MGPPGWPSAVPPPVVEGWEVPAVSWLLDFCPAEYRLYAQWRRHPIALAWLTERHVQAQLVAMRQAYREARVEFGDYLDPQGIRDVMAGLEREGVRLLAAARGARLIHEALQGKTFVAKL